MHRAALLAALWSALACSRTPAGPGDIALGPPPPATIGRLVSLAPGLTEIVVALGAAERIVGVTRFDDVPEVASAARVGGFVDPSPETIQRLAPDLLLVQPSTGTRGEVDLLARRGIAVRVLPMETLADVANATLALGELLGREDEARTQVKRLEEARARARSAALRRGFRPKVALVVGVEPLMAAGPGSFLHELLADAGAENIVEASPQTYPTLPRERLLSRRPDAVLLALEGPAVAADAFPPALSTRIRRLSAMGFLRPGPRVVEALDELTSVLDSLAVPNEDARR